MPDDERREASLKAITLIGLDREQRRKAIMLSAWFFLTVATLWVLKPVRVGSLLGHLGATEIPYVRLAGMVVLAVVVMLYSMLANRSSRIGLVRTVNAIYAAVLLAFWIALQIGGPELGAQRPMVWAVYILVEIYAVTFIGVFWTYANDIVTSNEANRLYGIVGLGGVLGGVAGGAFVDGLVERVGTVNLLAICAGLVVVAMVFASSIEAVVRPPVRRREPPRADEGPVALQGLAEARKSPYLLLIVGIVVAYEFTATLTDFGVSVIFEQTFQSEAMLAKMYGRLGWVVSVTAIVGQVIIVPLLLPIKRIALLVPPVALLLSAIGLAAAPVIAMAFVLSAADRGLNYSIHQVTKESLYVPLTDAQKYHGKAFIDMFVDRAAKAMAAFVLIAMIATAGASARVAVLLSLVSIGAWLVLARKLGRYWKRAPADATPSKPTAEPRAAASNAA